MFTQTPIAALGGASSRAFAIGRQGEVVGFADDGRGGGFGMRCAVMRLMPTTDVFGDIRL